MPKPKKPPTPAPTSTPGLKVRKGYSLPANIALRLDEEIHRRRAARYDAGDTSELSESDVLAALLDQVLPARKV